MLRLSKLRNVERQLADDGNMSNAKILFDAKSLLVFIVCHAFE